jgi:TctA family transporter
MRSRNGAVIWGAIAGLVIVAIVLAIVGGAIGAIFCAVIAIGLALFSPALRRRDDV